MRETESESGLMLPYEKEELRDRLLLALLIIGVGFFCYFCIYKPKVEICEKYFPKLSLGSCLLSNSVRVTPE